MDCLLTLRGLIECVCTANGPASNRKQMRRMKDNTSISMRFVNSSHMHPMVSVMIIVIILVTKFVFVFVFKFDTLEIQKKFNIFKNSK